VLSLTALVRSFQVMLGTFFLSILGIRRARQPVLLAASDADSSISLDVVPIDAWRRDPARKKVPGPQDAG
jgi:hypothetical protein